MGNSNIVKNNDRPLYIVFDTVENKICLEDAGLSEVANKLNINQSSVYYALSHESLVGGRYSIQEDIASIKQLDEWDKCCKELREKFGPVILSRINLVGVSND